MHEKYYLEYICLKVPHITTGNQENLLLFFGGAQIFLVEKIYFGIHFQFLSPQSKTNVLSVGNKNCKLKILNQEITVNAQPIRFQRERQRAEKNQCAYASYAGNLGKHLKIHSGEKSNKCNQCDYASSYASSLRRHLKTHSGEKSNKCNQCDYASSQASNLRTHLKTHSGEKTNKCSQCDYACSNPSALRTHLKTHSGEKKNKCSQCDYASSQTSDLRKNMQIHSGEK